MWNVRRPLISMERVLTNTAAPTCGKECNLPILSYCHTTIMIFLYALAVHAGIFMLECYV